MDRRVLIPITVLALSLTFAAFGPASAGQGSGITAKPAYLDDSKPIEERVEDALGRMTLEEKVAMRRSGTSRRKRPVATSYSNHSEHFTSMTGNQFGL